MLHKENLNFNNYRDDYANPELYQGGKSWDSDDDRMGDYRGWGSLIKKFLFDYRPSSILEIGPGSGYFSKMICESEFVQSYYGIDINKTFLDFLQPRIQEIVKNKPGFNFKLIRGDFCRTDLPQVDAVVIFSAVHHIPNRVDLFKALSTCLKENGKVLCIEPTHYLPRLYKLIRDFIREYHKRSYWMHRPNLSTHHFCTLAEFIGIASKVNFRVLKVKYYNILWFYYLSRIFSPLSKDRLNRHSNTLHLKIENQFFLLKYFSSEMGIILNKT